MKHFVFKNGVLYALVIVMSLAFMMYNQALGILGFLLCLVSFFVDQTLVKEESRRIQREIALINQEVEDINRDKLYELPMPMALTNTYGMILMANKCFEDCFRKGEERIKGRYIHDVVGINIADLKEGKPYNFSREDQSFAVIDTQFKEKARPLHLLHFVDMGFKKELEGAKGPNETTFCYILIDNYDEIIEQLPATERSAVLSRIAISLTDWANRLDAFLLEYESDHYVMVFDRDKLPAMEEDRFRILDEIREMDESIRVTLSMGIGVSEQHLSVMELDALSHGALDFALARGGDQCVVRNDEKLSFYGGKTEATEKRTKVKARVKAHALQDLIHNAANVLIMGHQTPDMDCLGAAVGLMGACRSLHKDCRFVLKEMNYSISALLDYLSTDEQFSHAFITPSESSEYITEGTLLIVVDTQSTGYVEMPELIESMKNIVVIDHHRRSGQGIGETVFDYIETYASSTCELVTELLQYFDNKDNVGKVEANTLLAGMCMDTKMFTVKTGVRTFEAAAYLKRKGADTVIAKTLLQNDLETYAAKSDAVRRARIYEGTIAISAFEDHSANAKIVAAQAADELLNIRGIMASFIILKSDDQILISGRSMGDVNVQLILEKLGGGGHLAIAGAQLKDVEDLKVAEEMLIEAIDQYKKERES
ncbi:DHH family phosphoesterase [Eubacterium sp.]|uniref:DHH family phosphoesterase n=1 Tax=Eubacterium sp. TaxID=142586 RepID=UPI002FC9EE1F